MSDSALCWSGGPTTRRTIPPGIAYALLAVVGATVLVVSAHYLWRLAQLVHMPKDLAWSLPVTLDVGAVMATIFPALLARLAPRWAPYKRMTGKSLRAELAPLGVKVASTGNRWPVDPVAVRTALAERATADLDDE